MNGKIVIYATGSDIGLQFYCCNYMFNQDYQFKIGLNINGVYVRHIPRGSIGTKSTTVIVDAVGIYGCILCHSPFIDGTDWEVLTGLLRLGGVNVLKDYVVEKYGYGVMENK